MPAEGPIRDRAAAGGDHALQLIETLRWETGVGFVRLDRHLARLCASAAALGFACDGQRVAKVLDEAVASADAPLRMRLVLSRDGDVAVSTQAFQPLPPGKVWTVRIARTRLDSADPLLRHKTSRRDVYVGARKEYDPAEADEVLLANERGELCEGTITSIFADFGDGVLATPRLECGLLPGILRGELLDHDKAIETVFAFGDLEKARALFVGNSLRGLIPAVIA
jgi:4-amino-4-deoxychorismate lyase